MGFLNFTTLTPVTQLYTKKTKYNKLKINLDFRIIKIIFSLQIYNFKFKVNKEYTINSIN